MINRLPNGYAIRPGTSAAGRAVPERASAPARGLSSRLCRKAAESVGTHPIASLGVAFATGLLLGKLVKR